MALIVFIYGLLILIGGCIGHWKTGSTASLTSGIAFGALLLIASFAMYKRKKWGHLLALILAIVLDGFFTYRFIKTGAFLPPGLLALVSFGVFVALAYRLSKAK